MIILLQVIAVVLVTDFVSGFFHWLEDAYGREHWPMTGWLITQPNVLHHHNPHYFTRYSWLESAWILLCMGAVVLAVAWACHLLTWRVWLFVGLGVNANQIHKWAHRTRAENGPIITWLQRLQLLQSPQHHARHHTDPKNSHYCVLTNLLNPILDSARFWDRLEAIVWAVFRLRRRVDTSVVPSRRTAPPVPRTQTCPR